MHMKWLSAALLLTACSTQSPSTTDAGPDPNCPWIDAGTCNLPSPSFQNDVLPLLDRTCNSTCHAPGVGPWPLNNEQDVFDWGSIIYGDIEACTMPPPDASAGNGLLTNGERAVVLNWLACASVDAGAP